MREIMSSFSKSASTSTFSENDSELRRGPWTLEEDTLLIHYIARHGEGRWNLLAKRSGLKRTGKSCRLRWLNYLKPDVKRGNLTPQEQISILELHSKWGNRWSKIAQHLPGRTDNEIKNYWRTRVQKQARHLKIDANSAAFQDVIRRFWMPTLLQKMEGSSSLSMLSQNSAVVSDQSFQQYSAISALPQISTQQEPIDIVSAGNLQRFDHHELNSSDSEHGATSCISSSESMNISQISQFSDYHTSPFHVTNSSNDYNTFAKDFCQFDNTCYDMETIPQPENMPAAGATGEYFGNPVRGFQMEDNSWVEYDLADSVWNMDELWQFKNSLEKGT